MYVCMYVCMHACMYVCMLYANTSQLCECVHRIIIITSYYMTVNQSIYK